MSVSGSSDELLIELWVQVECGAPLAGQLLVVLFKASVL